MSATKADFNIAVALGFSLAILAAKSTVLLSDPKKQVLNTLMFADWLSFLVLQAVYVSLELSSNILVLVMAMLYNIALCGILYISMNRTKLLSRSGGYLKKITGWLIYPLVVSFFLLRSFHSTLVYLESIGTARIVNPSIIQTSTGLSIFALRVFFDVCSLKAVINFQIITKRLLGGSVDGGDKAVKMMAINLAYEIFLSFFALGIAAVEVSGYKGSLISYVDWFLISWALGNSIDQRMYLRAIFQVRTPDSMSKPSVLDKL